ncbi:UDP-glucose dehydrogenase family protein [Halomonas urumqiensis]|uniref:UDP-glucose 6-dehydrogenase n=1 Tax=Halomonas urumqiensis TaxID=1684789 RepID=A0A2N7UCT9_9GAMM|nr:UDP-glucose/GDP-mannose dehydrogenase family protein [Halomonas urumqiensis]PMR78240.1 UDP-glucose 6-dehydrogenase [Halomonas urumqiensis]PTB03388.1 UDP-glucose/GDP-mannose dehydrogenase family protein [Halomonas urumqiensis]GHE20442.1 UDP-glucose 6-dehydrogenase [Halomonas urumqiensis]
MRITIFGSGYVGLVTGACLADVGHDVVCADVDEQKVARLQAGDVPIFEPGLENLVRQNQKAGRLTFTTDIAEAVSFGILQFIAVGTPSDEDGSADLRHVLEVAKSIGRHMTEYRIIVDKSTVPVGTASKVGRAVAAELDERGVALEFDVCSNPEFLKEGAAIEDFSRGSRIVVGTDSERVKFAMRECYGPYNRQQEKLMFMSVRSAELTKYAANAMLATKISFINEIANLAERLGADVEEVRRGIGSDPRIGYHFIYPGCGYGGSCFPKDVKALAHTAKQAGYPAEMIHAVERINARQKSKLFEKLCLAFDGKLAGKTIALWGLSFKPDTDDMREAPSRELMEALWQAGARVQAYDPEASDECRRLYGNRDDLMLAERREEVLEGAHALVVCTEWKAFRTIDFERLRDTLLAPVLIDGRNLYQPDTVKAAGLGYYAIGRGDSIQPVLA